MYFDMSVFGLPIGDGTYFVESLAYSDRYKRLVCVVGSRKGPQRRCFLRTLENSIYTEIELPFSSVCFALYEDQIVFAEESESRIQRCGTFNLHSETMRFGNLSLQTVQCTEQIVWISRFLPTSEAGRLHCIFTQQSIVVENGKSFGRVVISVGSLCVDDFSLTPILRLEGGIA